MSNNNAYWSLADEKAYLDGLGKWSNRPDRHRVKLLLSYIETIQYRKESWIYEAMEYARELLKDIINMEDH